MIEFLDHRDIGLLIVVPWLVRVGAEVRRNVRTMQRIVSGIEGE
jgi:hypothetical protein